MQGQILEPGCWASLWYGLGSDTGDGMDAWVLGWTVLYTGERFVTHIYYVTFRGAGVWRVTCNKMGGLGGQEGGRHM